MKNPKVCEEFIFDFYLTAWLYQQKFYPSWNLSRSDWKTWRLAP